MDNRHYTQCSGEIFERWAHILVNVVFSSFVFIHSQSFPICICMTDELLSERVSGEIICWYSKIRCKSYQKYASLSIKSMLYFVCILPTFCQSLFLLSWANNHRTTNYRKIVIKNYEESVNNETGSHHCYSPKEREREIETSSSASSIYRTFFFTLDDRYFNDSDFVSICFSFNRTAPNVPFFVLLCAKSNWSDQKREGNGKE